MCTRSRQSEIRKKPFIWSDLSAVGRNTHSAFCCFCAHCLFCEMSQSDGILFRPCCFACSRLRQHAHCPNLVCATARAAERDQWDDVSSTESAFSRSHIHAFFCVCTRLIDKMGYLTRQVPKKISLSLSAWSRTIKRLLFGLCLFFQQTTARIN